MRLKTIDLGLVDFITSGRKQDELFQEVKDGLLDAAILTCRHYPVITLGRSSSEKNLLVPREELARKGISVYKASRGGDVTYHGPGQLIVYPILNLVLFKKDLHWYLRFLEDVIIRSLAGFGVKAEQSRGLTGVWVAGRKIASIGIAVRNWISFHGLSVNVKEDDLPNFSLIRPCGMDIMMTSIESETGLYLCPEEFKKVFIGLMGSMTS